MNKKNILTLIIVIGLVVVAFWYLGYGSKDNSSVSLSTEKQSSQSIEAKQIYTLLQDMKDVELITTLFNSDSSFEKLRDNTVSFASQAAGRPNPFAPLGSDASFQPQVSTTSTSSKSIIKR